MGAASVERAARETARAVIGPREPCGNTAPTTTGNTGDSARHSEPSERTDPGDMRGHRYPRLDSSDPNGKEGVNGSSPLEGSLKAPHLRRFSCSGVDPMAGSDWKQELGVFPQCSRAVVPTGANRWSAAESRRFDPFSRAEVRPMDAAERLRRAGKVLPYRRY